MVKVTDMTVTAMTGTDLTVTQQLIETAAGHGSHTALIGPVVGEPCSYADLASIIKRAAAGLAWRGLRPRDIVAVYVPDAASYVLGCHAISAAGGIPCPVSPDLSVGEAAGQKQTRGERQGPGDSGAVAGHVAAAPQYRTEQTAGHRDRGQ